MRLGHCGFPSSNICYATLGKAAATVARIRRTSGAPHFLRAKEPFDEHAALALHMNCYGVVCAFKDKGKSQDWRKDVCPWISANDGTTSTVQINPIASTTEDHLVRNIYSQIYVHLYDKHPAIRKMVKSAMKSDLRTKDRGGCSAIRNRFKDKGGEFWVAKDNDDRSRVIGCVGISQRKKRMNDETEPSSTVVTEYEIQRLAVDNRHRGKGLGKKLLSVAEEFALQSERGIETKDASITKLWAVTPECLVAANKLYESVGYKKEETFQAGALLMNVYCKVIS